MTADDFTNRVEPKATHALSLVLAARLLWPSEQARFYHFIKFYFVRSAVCGLEDEQVFAKVWNLESDGAVEQFKECIFLRMLIMEQPFLRDVL